MTLFRFVKQVACLARKYSAAGLLKIRNPSGSGFAAWKHVVLHSLRIERNTTYADVVDVASAMDRVRRLLGLGIHEFPAPSTLCRSFHRAPMSVWRALFSRSAQLLDRSGHTAIDSTFFTRRQASPQYLQRIGRSVETPKITFLVDTAAQAILDVHCSARWPNDANIGPKLAARNLEKIESLAADKGYDSTDVRDTLRSEGVRPLIKHRLYTPIDHAHNARLCDELYNQRSLSEPVNSTIKRSIRETVSARAWFRQFREIVLIASVHNVTRAISAESHSRPGIQ